MFLKSIRLSVMLIGILTMFACVSVEKRMNDLEVGMTPEAVVDIMGLPRSTTAENDIKYFNYGYYCVKFADGKVVAYGPQNEINPKWMGKDKKKLPKKIQIQEDKKLTVISDQKKPAASYEEDRWEPAEE